MIIILSIAILVGILDACKTIQNTRLGIDVGVPPSKNLLDFIFLNK